MSEVNTETWSDEQIEEWEHDRWWKIQEMGDAFYKDEKDDKEMEGDPFEEEDGRKKKKKQKKLISR